MPSNSTARVTSLPARALYGHAAVAGLVAGSVMSMAMMLVALLQGQSILTMPDLIAAMWLGPRVADGSFGVPTMIGFLTHEMTSTVMGIVAVPFVVGLNSRRILLVSIAYALASYPLVFSVVLRWANPLMFERAPMVQMTWAHLLFGVVFGLTYTRLARRGDAS